MKANSLGMFYADLPAHQQCRDSEITFTFHWESDGRWEGKNYVVHVV